MSFEGFSDLYSWATHLGRDSSPNRESSIHMLQETQAIQKTLGESSAATRDVSGARRALDMMRQLPESELQDAWHGFNQHQKQQLELELLKERGAWHNSKEDATGAWRITAQDQVTTTLETPFLHPEGQAEKLINLGLQQDLKQFTENNSLKESPYSSTKESGEEIFLSHADAIITSLDTSEKQHEFNGNTHSEQQYRHPSLVISGGPLFDNGKIIHYGNKGE